MRRGMPAAAPAAADMRPSYRSTTSASSNAVPGTSSNGTILVNLDVFIQRATVGHDISPLDEDLIVLFRRNAKEITSEPTRWHSDHVAEWNQHVGIQTSLLRGKKSGGASEFLKKEYEVVLVALPSHSAVALFTVDFAELVQPQNPVRHKVYRISPLKCRDLAALLEFEIVWDYAVKAPAAASPLQSLPSPLPIGATGVSIAGLPPSSLLSTMKQQRHPQAHGHHAGYPDTASSISSRRTTASMSSQSSDRDPLADLAGGGCAECRASKRRLERKEMQILQLESFLKESQKRIDSLSVENDELVVREQAETTNAGQYRAMTVRLLQELEMAFQFCATQALQAQQAASDGLSTAPPDAVAASFMFLPQFEFMERVKQFHDELNALAGMTDDDCIDGSTGVRASPAGLTSAQDAWKLFDFRTEMDTALERNQRLQRQLEFLSRSLVYDVAGDHGVGRGAKAGRATPPRLHRTDTTASGDTSGGESDNSLDDSFTGSHAAPVLTMTEQINSLERENFVLKAKLERALEDAKHFSKAAPSALHSETGDTHSSSSRSSRRVHNDDVDGDIVDDDDDDPDARALHTELERVQDANAELAQANATLAQDKSALEREVATLQTSVEALQRQVDAHAAKLASSSSSGQDDASESAAPAAPGFLNKIYQDVGKAKMALEEKVKQLNALLRDATDENLRLLAKVEAQQELLDRGNATATPVSAAERPSDGTKSADRAWVSALEEQVEALQATLNDSSNQLAAKDRELVALTQRVAAADSAKSAAAAERDAVERSLASAQDRVTALERQVETLEQQQLQAGDDTKSASVPSSPSSFALSGATNDRSDEVAELSKQLKLAKQEVMQLRYRSNQMESVHERLEDALKEKRTLEVKLTALEGQLYDHRSRTISDNSFATDQSAMVTELQKQLDQRAAQLEVTQRELELLRRDVASHRAHGAASADDTADVDALGRKVARFEAEIAALCERNDAQACKLDALESRIARVTHERTELEGICRDLVEEMDAFTALQRSRDGDAVDSGSNGDEDRDVTQSTAFAPVAVAVPALVTATPTKVTDRYASALAASDRSGFKTAAAAAGPVPASASQSKVAHLIKNFSSDHDAADASGGRRPSDALSGKRFAKVDFRGRNGSSASARSNSNSTGSAVEAMAARFQSGTGASVRA